MMAGEVEESFTIDFQADSIHSGSISFGRFENEPLSWERRSSFSHNKYLEEVEKCSKPGSVIEKKAYFEAHFKKKGLFGISSASHDGSDRTASENEGSERFGYQEDFGSNEDSHYVQFNQRSRDDFDANEGEHKFQFDQRLQDNYEMNEDEHDVRFDQRSKDDFEVTGVDNYVQQISREDFEPNENSCLVQFDDSPYESDHNGECREADYERKDAFTERSFSNMDMESGIKHSSVSESSIDVNTTMDETQHARNETINLLSVNEEMNVEMKKNLDEAVNTDGLLGVTVTEPAEDVKEMTLHDAANLSPKAPKPEPVVNSVVNNAQIQKSISRSTKDFARQPIRESPRRMNAEKNLTKNPSPNNHSVSRTSKSEVFKSEEKVIRENRREKVSRVKKAVESQPSVLNSDSGGIQEAKRLNQGVNSTKSDARPKAGAFNFKSSVRAERRKEFYMKMEEKLHAKEVEINQMQAISQEKTEADIKKFRKSLNFKATPMPSFYHTPRSNGNKAAKPNNITTKKAHNKPKCEGSEADATPLSNSKTENDQTKASVGKCTTTGAFETRTIYPDPSTNQSSHQESATKSTSFGKNERAKATFTLQKQRVSESIKAAKRQSNEAKQKVETPKQSNEIRRNVGLRSSSRIGNLAVHVAS